SNAGSTTSGGRRMYFWIVVHWYHGHNRTNPDRHPHREANPEGPQGTGGVPRPQRRRSARRHPPARLRRESAVRPASAEKNRRAEESLRARSERLAQPQARGGQKEMSDAEIVDRFERAGVDQFHHADHVRTAFAYLRTMPLLEALGRFTAALRRFAAAQGK